MARRWSAGRCSIYSRRDVDDARAPARVAQVFRPPFGVLHQLAHVVVEVAIRCVLERMRQVFSARRIRMVNALNAIDGVSCRMPEGAFYAFANVSGLLGRRAAHQ